MDFRYIVMARGHIRGAEVLLQDNLEEQLKQLIVDENLKCIGTDVRHITLQNFQEYQRMTGGLLTSDTRLEEVIGRQRKVKSAEEISRSAKARDILERMFERITPVSYTHLDVYKRQGK